MAVIRGRRARRARGGVLERERDVERDGGTVLDDSGSCRGRHAGREEDLDEPFADVVLEVRGGPAEGLVLADGRRVHVGLVAVRRLRAGFLGARLLALELEVDAEARQKFRDRRLRVLADLRGALLAVVRRRHDVARRRRRRGDAAGVGAVAHEVLGLARVDDARRLHGL